MDRSELRKGFAVLNDVAFDAALDNQHGHTFTYYRDAMARRLSALPRDTRERLLARAAAKYHIPFGKRISKRR
jgi:hypothetical protein